jgi:protein-S-isoprenylcysteine O-methyltransferase Ste14
MSIPAPYAVTLAIWLGWWISWWAAARWAAPAKSRLSQREEMRHRVFMIAGAALLFLPLGGLSPALQLYFPTRTVAWTLTTIIALGFAFCWWARLHLGKLWSGSITTKADHRIVDSGPYGLVRHPIYTGILTAAFATALERGTAIAIVGAVLMTISLTIKARMEEGFLRNELGPEAYDAYRSRVPMLVPFWRMGL